MLVMARKKFAYDEVELDLRENDPFVSMERGIETQEQELQILQSLLSPAHGEK